MHGNYSPTVSLSTTDKNNLLLDSHCPHKEYDTILIDDNTCQQLISIIIPEWKNMPHLAFPQCEGCVNTQEMFMHFYYASSPEITIWGGLLYCGGSYYFRVGQLKNVFMVQTWHNARSWYCVLCRNAVSWDVLAKQSPDTRPNPSPGKQRPSPRPDPSPGTYTPSLGKGHPGKVPAVLDMLWVITHKIVASHSLLVQHNNLS